LHFGLDRGQTEVSRQRDRERLVVDQVSDRGGAWR
jgi:hypothetical protein